MEQYREKVHAYRVIPMLFILLFTAGLDTAFCYLNHAYWDEMICIGVISALFYLLLLFELVYERKHYGLNANQSTTYSRVTLAYFICSCMCFGFSYLPAFIRPFMLFPLIFAALSNEVIGFCCSMHFLIVFILTNSGDFYEVVCYGIAIAVASVLAKALTEKAMRIWIGLLLFFVHIAFSAAFYYLAMEQMDYEILIYSGISGVVIFLFASILFGAIRKDSMKEFHNRLLDVISDDYAVVKALRKDFPGEYHHARKVADISYRCAKEIGLDVRLAETAAFYYRIGKWQGEPHVERGVEKAIALCLPQEVVEIVAEYYGEQKLPSSPVSALVHMVDSLSIKIEAMSKDVGLSSWNQEMIIYQTLNEYSNTGIYDESGLGMNQFLKAREYLVKEDWVQ